jgi:hypothetical protein
VIEEYFDLLFNEDTVTTGIRRTHRRRLPESIMESSMVKRIAVPTYPFTKAPSVAVTAQQRKTQQQQGRRQSRESRSPLRTALLDASEAECAPSSSSPFADTTLTGSNHEDPPLATTTTTTITDPFQSHSDHDASLAEKAFGDFNSFLGGGGGGGGGGAVGGGEEDGNLQIMSAVAAKPKGPDAPALTFTEFLRVNMRLAEDRVLSFVLVFCTGFGTKWVPGATFYYSPEVSFQTLLTQRRRWINGTVASYFYFFTSQRARLRVQGGFFVSTHYHAVDECYMLYAV